MGSRRCRRGSRTERPPRISSCASRGKKRALRRAAFVPAQSPALRTIVVAGTRWTRSTGNVADGGAYRKRLMASNRWKMRYATHLGLLAPDAPMFRHSARSADVEDQIAYLADIGFAGV